MSQAQTSQDTRKKQTGINAMFASQNKQLPKASTSEQNASSTQTDKTSSKQVTVTDTDTRLNHVFLFHTSTYTD